MTPDFMARHVQTFRLGCRMSHFIVPVLQFYLTIVCRGLTRNNASKENNRIILQLHQRDAVKILKMKLQWMKGKLGGRVADKNVAGGS